MLAAAPPAGGDGKATWAVQLHPDSGLVYYKNTSDGAASWRNPFDAHPFPGLIDPEERVEEILVSVDRQLRRQLAAALPSRPFWSRHLVGKVRSSVLHRMARVRALNRDKCKH